MTPKEILRLADEAGLIHNEYGGYVSSETVIKFAKNVAKNVAQHEREECARLADECLNIEELGSVIRARGKE